MENENPIVNKEENNLETNPSSTNTEDEIVDTVISRINDTPVEKQLKRLTKKQKYRLEKKRLKEEKNTALMADFIKRKEEDFDDYMREFSPDKMREAEKEKNYAYIINQTIQSMIREAKEREERYAKPESKREMTDADLKLIHYRLGYDRPIIKVPGYDKTGVTDYLMKKMKKE